jgi:signal transduction histidine kinase
VNFRIEVKRIIYDNEECKLVLLYDVTELQQLEEERQKVRLMKMLTTTVSHDIMTPILTIKNFAM